MEEPVHKPAMREAAATAVRSQTGDAPPRSRPSTGDAPPSDSSLLLSGVRADRRRSPHVAGTGPRIAAAQDPASENAGGSADSLLPGLRRPTLLRHVDQGVLENNAARSGGWWLRAWKQLPLWEALEVGDAHGVRIHLSAEIAERLGPPTLLDKRVLVVLTTLWADYPPEERAANLVRWTRRRIYRYLGHRREPNGEELRAVADAIERLAHLSLERTWYDAATDRTTRSVRRFISGADFSSPGAGRRRAADEGWISWSKEYFDQLLRVQLTYALDLVCLGELSPLAASLYLVLGGMRMTPLPGERAGRLELPLGRALYENLGLAGEQQGARHRHALTAACAELRAADPVYRRLEIVGRRERGHSPRYLLVVEREARRSRAPEARARRGTPAAVGVRTPAPQLTAVAAACAVDHEQRERARVDPLVRDAFEALLRYADDPDAVLRIVAFRRERMAFLCGEAPVAPPVPSERGGDPTDA